MAEAFCRRGAKVTLVEASDQIMRTFDADMAKPIMNALGAHGIEVGLGVRVTGFETDGVITASGKIAADVVVLGIGIMPNSGLAGAAGLTLGVRNAISVDRRQQTSAQGVYAAGDCAESFHLVSRRNVHVALGTVANKQSRVAGINLGGGYATFPGVIGTAISKICSLEVARTGLTEVEAADAGFGATAVSISATTRAGYFPGAEPITVKLVVERGSARILGGQITGGSGSGKRIDSIAVAVTAGWSAEDLLNADLAYAPPFSGVWDPVQIAAREALKI
jgi:NADPH-dependent 2,4-dienoyl-CoA reductase/sulfur reductase-like enzyme